ncbi:MAG: hypothetical protein J6C60_02885, partial [Alistipes sp.]|nr:hypothetical protein [Alistipes sp.]MBO5399727.1 hypothetical protein [Alistipes sp.]
VGTQLVLGFAKRSFSNLCNALNSKPNSQTIRILSSYCNIPLFSFVFILKLYNKSYFEAGRRPRNRSLLGANEDFE